MEPQEKRIFEEAFRTYRSDQVGSRPTPERPQDAYSVELGVARRPVDWLKKREFDSESREELFKIADKEVAKTIFGNNYF